MLQDFYQAKLFFSDTCIVPNDAKSWIYGTKHVSSWKGN